MLQLTSRATTALKEERSNQGLPDHFGIRVHAERRSSGPVIRFGFTDEPIPGDEEGVQEGLRVFVAAEVAEALSDRVIDAQSPSSDGDGAAFVLRDGDDGAE